MFLGVIGLHVDGHEAPAWRGEQRPRFGGEVLEAGPDADYHVGRLAERVGGGRAVDPGGAEVQGMGLRNRGLAGLRLDDRDAVAFREGRERRLSFGICDAAAADDDLLRRHPDLVGLYVAGGGLDGVMQAIREEGAFSRLVTVGRELNVATWYGLIDGTLDLAISYPMKAMAEAVVSALTKACSTVAAGEFQKIVLPTEPHIRENIKTPTSSLRTRQVPRRGA